MKLEKYLELQKTIFGRCMALSEKKGLDYSGNEDNLKNIKFSSFFGVVPELGVLVRIGDKLQRIRQFVEVGELKNEKFSDSVLDTINYLTLLLAVAIDLGHVKEEEVFG